ncbi:uncharacterized protein LOC111707432 isoform X3 [Eurytemora carolleeae]|uniref:uncharacterized protein LOC111707432 isoform X3 n=1 Tax=Eurytemora carolleeae TaxID=1294199 RepID=UPI000C76EEFD|nr:uncharacterized protein LOC111707432 isoform X3 [Eurytemora carolleeae]|eukprot:XP_023336308.1 uncharacterized protein LOC111707432 isoform X3 [Eurytemora affinis]
MKIFSKMISSITIGVLGIQGSIQEHIDLLQIAISRMSLRTGIKTRTVGKADDLHGVDGLIIPGRRCSNSRPMNIKQGKCAVKSDQFQ